MAFREIDGSIRFVGVQQEYASFLDHDTAAKPFVETKDKRKLEKRISSNNKQKRRKSG